MTNIEERFKKDEVDKPAPIVNKIQIPTFEKSADSDEVGVETIYHTVGPVKNKTS